MRNRLLCTILSHASRRPAVAGAVLLMLGIGLYRAFPLSPAVWIGVAALCLGGAGALWRWAGVSSVALGLSIVFAGVAGGQVAGFCYPDHDISEYAGDEPRLAELELTILHPPRLVTTPLETGRPLPPRQVTSARIHRIHTTAGWVEARGQTLVKILEPHPQLQVGQTLRVLGRLERPAPAANPGQLNWAAYYREQRILTSLQIPNAENIQILSTPARTPLTWLREQVRRLLAKGFAADQSLDHALLRALLLGDHDPELRDVQDDFRRTGTSHHLSISGMHVAVLGGFVFLICRLVMLPPRWVLAATLIFVVFYGLVALPSPPVVRSVLLCLIVGVGWLGRRSVDAIQLLAISVIGMLVYHPLDLFNPGFQLSFGTVLGLMVLTRPMATFLAGAPDLDQMALARGGLLSRRQRLAHWADQKFMQAIAAGLVAWAVSLPLVATHFEQMNPWAVLAGLILAPLVFLALIGGLLKIVLTLLWPGGAGMWADVAAAPIAGTRHLVDALARIPGSDVPLPAPPWWLMVLFYGLILLTLVRVSSPSLRWMRRAGPVAACAAVLLLPFHTTLERAVQPGGELRITFLHVGAGQCAVLEPPSGRVMLLDAGSSSLTDLQFRCLGPYLRHRGITSIDSIVITHANWDHYSAVAEVARTYDVREVLTSAHFRAHATGSAPAERLLRELDDLDRPPRVVLPGQSIPLGRDSELEILWPPEQIDLDENDASLVFRIRHAGRSILVTGDIQEPGLRDLLADPEQLRSDILIAPHHGSSEPATADFLAAVGPKLIISSNDRTLTAKQRHFNDLAGATPLLRTPDHGAITLTFTADGQLHVESHLQGPIDLPTLNMETESPRIDTNQHE